MTFVRGFRSIFWRALAAFVLLLTIATPAQARWLKITTEHFNVYGPQAETEVRQVALDLERYHAALGALIRTQDRPRQRLDVYLLDRHEDVRRVMPELGMSYVGIYSNGPTGSQAILSWGISDRTAARRILFHEYAHHYLNQTVAQSFPAWFSEGFAEYLASATFSSNQVRIGESADNRLLQLSNEPWMSLETLVNLQPGIDDDLNRGMMYAQGWLLTQYLMQDQARSRQLISYFQLTGEGKTPTEAFPQAFGASFSGMEQRLKAYLRSPRLLIYPIPATVQLGATATTLDASADDMMFLSLRMQGSSVVSDEAAQQALLTQIRTIAARHPTAPFAQVALAEAEYRYGDATATLRVLEALPAAASDAHSLYLIGLSLVKLGGQDGMTRARNAFALSVRADTTYFPALEQYAYTFPPQSKESLDALVRAQSLAPQVPSLRLTTASRLMRAGEYDNATGLLLPLANSPHANNLSVTAAILLEAAQRREPPPRDLNARVQARMAAARPAR